MGLNDWYDRGISATEYKGDLDKHEKAFNNIYNNFNVPESDRSELNNDSDMRVLVLAEAWCGHCMLDIPILLKMCETANIPVRFLRRDDNLELMDQYLTNEKRVIPIFIFIDKDGNELVKWGPMAPEIREFVTDLRKDMPEKDNPAYEEAFQTLIKKVASTFSVDETLWNYVYEDIRKTAFN